MVLAGLKDRIVFSTVYSMIIPSPSTVTSVYWDYMIIEGEYCLFHFLHSCRQALILVIILFLASFINANDLLNYYFIIYFSELDFLIVGFSLFSGFSIIP